MNLISSYVEKQQLVQALCVIVTEELEHFQLAMELLAARRIGLRRIKPSNYGRQLNELVRKQEPGRAIDRLLVAALIEARSCERFGILRDHIELAHFYGNLFESEARHHSTYLQAARLFGAESVVDSRLEAIADREAEIISLGDILPRMHS